MLCLNHHVFGLPNCVSERSNHTQPNVSSLSCACACSCEFVCVLVGVLARVRVRARERACVLSVDARARGALTCSHVRTVRMLHIPAHMCSTTNTNTNAHTRTLTCCSDISTLRPQFPHASPCVSAGACVRGGRRGCRFHFFVRSMSGTHSFLLGAGGDGRKLRRRAGTSAKKPSAYSECNRAC